jgi:hypothetical protein
MSQAELIWPRQSAPAAPEASWPFVPSAAFAQAVRRLLAATQGLSLAGWEASCRLSPGGITTNRLLLGLDTAGVAVQRLHAMPQTLGMPQALANAFLSELRYARRLLVAVEQGPQGLEFRAYHEFEAAAIASADLPPALVMRGRKWRGEGLQLAVRTTDYLRPTMDVAAWKRWLREPTGMPEAAAPAMDLLTSTLSLVRMGDAFMPDFLTVIEPPSSRLSCCVRLYDKHLTLQALRPALTRLAQAWNLPQALLSRLPGQRRLGWLAVGTDALGSPFLTLYAVSSLADARQAITLGAFDDHF